MSNPVQVILIDEATKLRRQPQFHCILNRELVMNQVQKMHDLVVHRFDCGAKTKLLNMEMFVMHRFVCWSEGFDLNLAIRERVVTVMLCLLKGL